MRRILILVFSLSLLSAAAAQPAPARLYETLLDGEGRLSMLHLPGDTWIELVLKNDGTFHKYVFRELARTDWYAVVEDKGRQLLFWVPIQGSKRFLFLQDSGTPLLWGSRFHHEWINAPALPLDPYELMNGDRAVFEKAGIEVGRDYDASQPPTGLDKI